MRNRYVLTKFGQPEPWTPEEVQVYLAKVNRDIETPGVHGYNHYRRVWVRMMTPRRRTNTNEIQAQKPFDKTLQAVQKPEVEAT